MIPALAALLGCGTSPEPPGNPSSAPTCPVEIPYDGVDQDCDGADLVDVDGDGFDGFDAGGTDCDDARPDVWPGADDPAGDGVDADCDGTDGVDADGDGTASAQSGGSDCDDADADVHPGAVDTPYDGVDADCARDCDYDADADGAPEEGAPIAEDDACDTLVGPGLPAADCDDADPLATWSLVSTDPTAGAWVTADTAFRATFTGDAATAVLTLADADGNAVAGTTTYEGSSSETAVFTPDAPLLGGSAYTLDVAAGCGGASIPVSTLVDADALVGQSWQLAWASGEWTLPGSPVELLFRVVVGSEAMQVELVAADTLRIGSETTQAAPYPQELCEPTSDAAFDLYANPRFTFAPTTLFAGGLALPLENGAITGRIADGGATVTDVQLVGSIDITPLDAVVDNGNACDTFASFGLPCELCPVSGATSCVTAQIDDIPTDRIAASPLQVVTPADVDADPACL